MAYLVKRIEPRIRFNMNKQLKNYEADSSRISKEFTSALPHNRYASVNPNNHKYLFIVGKFCVRQSKARHWSRWPRFLEKMGEKGVRWFGSVRSGKPYLLYVIIMSRMRFRVNLHYSCLNLTELQNRSDIWSLSDSNGIRTHNHNLRCLFRLGWRPF